MDERQLETLFRDAAGEPPEPTFGVGEVAKASRRATLRQRTRVTAVCGAVVVVLVGVGVVTAVRENSGEVPASALSTTEEVNGNTQLGPLGQPGDGPGRQPNAPNPSFPSGSPMQGGETTGETGPRAEGTYGCDQVDRELATALAGELPVPVTGEATPARLCGTEFRSAQFPVPGGFVAATALHAGVIVDLVTGPNDLVAEAQSSTGSRVIVVSMPAPGSTDPPFAKDLQGIADALGARF